MMSSRAEASFCFVKARKALRNTSLKTNIHLVLALLVLGLIRERWVQCPEKMASNTHKMQQQPATILQDLTQDDLKKRLANEEPEECGWLAMGGAQKRSLEIDMFSAMMQGILMEQWAMVSDKMSLEGEHMDGRPLHKL
jgi:hypothetical protein